jgi:hypothetical protein
MQRVQCRMMLLSKYDHLVNRSNSSTGQTAAKACSGHCEAFFLRVLGDPQQPGSAPWPAVGEMKPKQELQYFASERVSVLAR